MPELPEVEIVRRTLNLNIKNRIIDSVDIFYEPIIEGNANEFKNKLKGKQILDVERYGKYLIFIFDEFVVVSHLRMEGKFYYAHDKDGDNDFGPLLTYNKHNHIIFNFKDHNKLLYNDTRKFGKMKILPLDYMNYLPLVKLGKEPFCLTKEELFNKIHNRNIYIKQLLLDQTIICGLGNIYVDETLNKCKISPFEKGKNITQEQCSLIIDSACHILNNAIYYGGSTIKSYHSSNGVDGRFQNELKVYNRNDKTCYNCGHYIVKTFIGGRGTCFCPVCQQKIIDKNIKIIGLTGLMGSGKSTVSSYLKSKNIKVIDADEIVKDLYKKNHLGYKLLIKKYKNIDLINDDGIDHKKLRNYVLENGLIEELNSLIHPLVEKEILSRIKGDFCVLDVPLLFESGIDKYCDLTVCVSITKQNQIERLIHRNNMPLTDAIKLINKQENREDKYYKSDIIIDNNFDLKSLYSQIDNLLDKLNIKKGESI